MKPERRSGRKEHMPRSAISSSASTSRTSHGTICASAMEDSRPPPALLRALIEPSSAVAAANALLQKPEWLTGSPPDEVLTALGDSEHGPDNAILDLACCWEREPLAAALMRAIERESDVERRRRFAWVAKQ